MLRRKKVILIAFGTRPEALKFAPLIKEFQRSKHYRVYVCLTGQHRQMLDQVVKFFNLPVHTDLRLMRKNQSLTQLSSGVLSKFDKVLRKVNPDLVFVQGDTSTALMVGIAAFYSGKRLAHLEAGLRTWNRQEPFPEEMNRTVLARISDYHFTPTSRASRNLLDEGIPKRAVYQIGNTVVDSIQLARKFVKKSYPIFKSLDPSKRLILVTAHRRESFGDGLKSVFHAIKRICKDFSDVEFLYPVHLNPNVREPALKMLGKLKGVHLTRPLTYEETCWALENAYLVLTDSGGLQEEAPSFKKPVLVLRNVTERPEGITAGVAKIVGTDAAKIYRETKKLLESKAAYKRMEAKRNPYGDGQACKRILEVLTKELYCS